MSMGEPGATVDLRKPSQQRPSNLPIVVAVIAVLTAGIALPTAFLVRWDLPFNQSSASIELTGRLDERVVAVNGTTDLPDGSVVEVRFWHERNDEVSSGRTGPYQRLQRVEVGAGAFNLEQDLTEWPEGVVTVWAEFRVYRAMQPTAVTDRFGERGERLGGSQAVMNDSDDSKYLLADVKVTLPPVD